MLSKELGCHLFREISVKESWEDPKRVYYDLWRMYNVTSHGSPSWAQRKRFSHKVQHKIPTLNSKPSTPQSRSPLVPRKVTQQNHEDHFEFNKVLTSSQSINFNETNCLESLALRQDGIRSNSVDKNPILLSTGGQLNRSTIDPVNLNAAFKTMSLNKKRRHAITSLT